MDAVNHQFRLVARPQGMVGAEHFSYVEEPVGEPADGQALVEILYVSLDPAMRGWMNEGRSYVPPVQIGEVMRAATVGRVLESRSERFAVGDHVSSWLGVQRYAVAGEDALLKIDVETAPLPTYLGALGMPGMTAYFGLLDVGQPKEGETVVVSGAAGAVGSVVGQIAKLKGCRTVGIAGGEQKCSWIVDELGFDAAIDYKAQDVPAALREHCPKGIDVYFDNVGGEILDAALARLARGARVVICGAISQYNNQGGKFEGPSNYMSLLVNRAKMEGFVVIDYIGRYAEAMSEMAGWIADGKLLAREEVVEGFERFPEALQALFRGENVGKLVLKV
jgi:NADPH-dependent curcumin reductase